VTLKPVNGKNTSHASLHQEKSLVIVFFRGRWCPICTKHTQRLINVYPELKENRGFVYPMANRPVVVIPLVALFHFVMHLAAVLFSFKASMKYFESGAEPTVGLQILHTLANILDFPLVLLIQ